MTRQPGSDATELARRASLLADATRAGMCLALLDGRAWTAGELGRLTGVAPSTASEHLDRLVGGGLITEQRRGRHRYLRLAGPQVAEMIEDLGGHAGPGSRPRSLRAVSTESALARGRTCYDHLAGRLGVAILDAMADRGLVELATGVSVAPAGLDWLADLGIDIDALRATRRPLARVCLDWTERRPHLAGAAGAALCTRLMDAGWVRRTGRSRAVDVTAPGRRELERRLGLTDPGAGPEVPGTGLGGR